MYTRKKKLLNRIVNQGIIKTTTNTKNNHFLLKYSSVLHAHNQQSAHKEKLQTKYNYNKSFSQQTYNIHHKKVSNKIRRLIENNNHLYRHYVSSDESRKSRLNKEEDKKHQVIDYKKKFDISPPSNNIPNKLNKWIPKLTPIQKKYFSKQCIKDKYKLPNALSESIKYYQIPRKINQELYDEFSHSIKSILVDLRDEIKQDSQTDVASTESIREIMRIFTQHDLSGTYLHVLLQAALISVQGDVGIFIKHFESLPYWTLDLYYFAFLCMAQGDINYSIASKNEILSWFKEEYEDRYTFTLKKMPVYKNPILPYEMLVEISKIYDDENLLLVINHVFRGVKALDINFIPKAISNRSIQNSILYTLETGNYKHYDALYKEGIFHNMVESNIEFNEYVNEKVMNSLLKNLWLLRRIFEYALSKKDFTLAGTYLESIEYNETYTDPLGPKVYLRKLFLTSIIISSEESKIEDIEDIVANFQSSSKYLETKSDSSVFLQLLGYYYVKYFHFERFFQMLPSVVELYSKSYQSNIFKMYMTSFPKEELESILVGLENYIQKLEEKNVTLDMISLLLHLYYQLDYYNDFFNLFSTFEEKYPGLTMDYKTYIIGLKFFNVYGLNNSGRLLLSHMAKNNFRITNQVYRLTLPKMTFHKHVSLFIPKILSVGAQSGTVAEKPLMRAIFLKLSKKLPIGKFDHFMYYLNRQLPLPYFYYYWKILDELQRHSKFLPSFDINPILKKYEVFFDGFHEYDLINSLSNARPTHLLPTQDLVDHNKHFGEELDLTNEELLQMIIEGANTVEDKMDVDEEEEEEEYEFEEEENFQGSFPKI